LRSPYLAGERGSSGSVTAIACRRSRPVVGRLTSSRSSFRYLFRPSPARTRLGASSASPERSRTISFDTLVARSAPFGASRAEDRSCPPRVNATSSFDPGCLRLRAVIEGAVTTVSRDHLFRRRFHGHEPRSPATSSRLSRRASASALSFRTSPPAFTGTVVRRSGSLVRSWASPPAFTAR